MITLLHVGKIKEMFIFSIRHINFSVFSSVGCDEGNSCQHHEGVFTCIEDTKCLEDSNSFIFNHFFGSEYLDVEMELVSGKLLINLDLYLINYILECRLKSAEPMEGFTCGNDPTVSVGSQVYIKQSKFNAADERITAILGQSKVQCAAI